MTSPVGVTAPAPGAPGSPEAPGVPGAPGSPAAPGAPSLPEQPAAATATTATNVTVRCLSEHIWISSPARSGLKRTHLHVGSAGALLRESRPSLTQARGLAASPI